MWATYRFWVIASCLILSSVPASRAEDKDSAVHVEFASDASAPRPKRVGGAVSAPTLIHAVEMKGLTRMDSGLVLNLWVDVDGVPSHIRVLQGGDLTQNEKIISAVRQYRFKPAMENGKPVLVEMNMEVSVD